MLKFGYITNYDECGRVKVKIEDEDNVITDFIPVIRTSASKDETGSTIDMNTLVSVILDDLNLLNGVCLGAVNTKPVKSINKKYHQFTDGSTIEYDRENHILTTDVKGEITAKANKTTIEGDLFVKGSIIATKDITDKKSSMQSIRDTYNAHKNPNNGNSIPDKQM